MNTKNLSVDFNKKQISYCIILKQILYTQEYKAAKTQTVRLQLNEKKSQESLTSLEWKGKLTWRKDLITYNSHPWIMFSFNWFVIIWRGKGSFKMGRPTSMGWKNFERRWTRGKTQMDNFHGRHKCIISYLRHKFINQK